jgi:hypothetical protein
VASSGEHGNEPSGSVKCGELIDKRETVRFSRSTQLYAVIVQRT